MKKRNIIIVSMLILIIIEVVAIALAYQESQRLTIDDITNNMFSQYDHTHAKNEKSKATADSLIKKYSAYSFEPYSGSIGNTSHSTYGLYDSDDNLLFVMTFIGNNNLVQITIDGKTTTYQGK